MELVRRKKKYVLKWNLNGLKKRIWGDMRKNEIVLYVLKNILIVVFKWMLVIDYWVIYGR